MEGRAQALAAIMRVRAAETEARAKALTALALVKADPHRDRRRRDAVIAALAFWFGSKAAITATRLPDNLLDMLVEAGIDRLAAEQVSAMATDERLTGRTRHGSPQPIVGGSVARRMASGEPQMRANYTIAAAERLTAAIKEGDFDHAVEVEKTYLDLHLQAARNRRSAARKLDGLAVKHRYFIWRTRGDQRVEAECRGYAGRIFRCDDPPAIPGAVHLRCRCWPEGVAGPLIDWGTPHPA